MSYGHNTLFLKDPRAYLGGITVIAIGSRFAGIKETESHDLIYMDLVVVDSGMNTGTKIARADFSKSPAGDAQIKCGFVPYISAGICKFSPEKLPSLKLPLNGDPAFVFTGAMNGCSLVYAERDGDDYAIHYPNSDGATSNFPMLASNKFIYKKSIDYLKVLGLNQGTYSLSGYKSDLEASEAMGNKAGFFNAFAFFYYDNGTWKIIAQPQFAWQSGMTFKAKTTGPLVEV